MAAAPETLSRSVPGVFVGLAPWAFVASAKNDSVESGAPTLLLNVSEPLLLMA